MTERAPKQSRFVEATVIGGISFAAWRALDFSPVMVGGNIDLLPAAVVGAMTLSGVALASELLRVVANVCGTIKARTPRGIKGKARFAKSLRELRRHLTKRERGLYLGSYRGKAIFANITTSAHIIGNSGSGKTSKLILCQILALAGWASKIIYDWKPEIIAQIAAALEAEGERLAILDLSGQLQVQLGRETDYLNPLEIVTEAFQRKYGLMDITEIVRELCCVLSQDEATNSGMSNAEFWKSNERRIIGFAIIVNVILYGERATLGMCLNMINDKASILRYAELIAGRLEGIENGQRFPAKISIETSPWAHLHDPGDVANFEGFLRPLASGLADVLADKGDGKLADSMLSGARESALRCFDITTRANKVSSKSTISAAALKDKDTVTTLCVMLDPNKPAAMEEILAVYNWYFTQVLRRHPNKDRKVWAFIDEAGNLPWRNLVADLTTLRGFGVVPVFAYQNIPAFENRHGKYGFQTLQSEAQALLVMPGTRNIETIEFVQKLLSKESVIVRSHNSSAASGVFSIDSTSYQEIEKPLMFFEDIWGEEKGLLWLGNCRPLKADLFSVAAIFPWKYMLSKHPFTGKRYWKWTKLCAQSRLLVVAKWIWKTLKHLIVGRRP